MGPSAGGTLTATGAPGGRGEGPVEGPLVSPGPKAVGLALTLIFVQVQVAQIAGDVDSPL